MLAFCGAKMAILQTKNAGKTFELCCCFFPKYCFGIVKEGPGWCGVFPIYVPKCWLAI